MFIAAMFFNTSSTSKALSLDTDFASDIDIPPALLYKYYTLERKYVPIEDVIKEKSFGKGMRASFILKLRKM